MKALKISLLVIIMAGLGWIGYTFYIRGINKLVIPQTTNNIFVDEITGKIEALKGVPVNVFCVAKYISIKNDITQYAVAKKIDDVWESNLLKSLDYTYAPVYVRQSYYVFGGTDWELDKLGIIRAELNKLLSSPYIDNKTELNKIKGVLREYDEIVVFISNAGVFTGSTNITNFNQGFDVNRTSEFIAKASAYRGQEGYVKNCLRLQTALVGIPMSMYRKHLSYLSQKVNFCSGKFGTFDNYADYYNTIYKPVFGEFDLLASNIESYSVSGTQFDNDVSSLKEQMKRDNKAAAAYKYPD
jgi:hypothetical protein